MLSTRQASFASSCIDPIVDMHLRPLVCPESDHSLVSSNDTKEGGTSRVLSSISAVNGPPSIDEKQQLVLSSSFWLL